MGLLLFLRKRKRKRSIRNRIFGPRRIISVVKTGKFVRDFFFMSGCNPTIVMASLFLRIIHNKQNVTRLLRLWTSDRLIADVSTLQHKISMPAGFEPTISAGEWPQNHGLDPSATGIGSVFSDRMSNIVLRGRWCNIIIS